MALVVGTNSYASRADADTYFNDSLRKTEWAAYSGSTKDRGLIEATRVFERQVWAGSKEVGSQALAFPRTGLKDKEGESLTGAETLVIVGEAQFEYALVLLADADELNTRDSTGSNVKQVGAGSAKIVFFKATKGARFPVSIMDLIGDWFGGGGSAVIGGVVSGNCDSSSFTSPDDKYGTIKGFD